MRTVIIPARAGSKRIPRKNTSSFLGKPIIQYSIENAMESSIYDKIVISTDDETVAELATDLGIPTKPDRPSRLSDDETPIVDVLRYEVTNKRLIDHTSITLLFACAPLVESEDLISATALFENQEECSSLMTIAEYPVPTEWAMTIEDRKVVFESPQLLATPSNKLKQKFYDAGQFYIYKPRDLDRKTPGLITDGILPFLIPKHKAVDIDNYEDWKLAEKLYSAQFNL